MSRELTLSLWPVRILIVRMAVYSGKINCHTIELFAKTHGKDLKTADGSTIRPGEIMTVRRSPNSPEFERRVVCDDESRFEEAVQMLHDSLRQDTLKAMESAQAIYSLASNGEVVRTLRAFID